MTFSKWLPGYLVTRSSFHHIVFLLVELFSLISNTSHLFLLKMIIENGFSLFFLLFYIKFLTNKVYENFYLNIFSNVKLKYRIFLNNSLFYFYQNIFLSLVANKDFFYLLYFIDFMIVMRLLLVFCLFLNICKSSLSEFWKKDCF